MRRAWLAALVLLTLAVQLVVVPLLQTPLPPPRHHFFNFSSVYIIALEPATAAPLAHAAKAFLGVDTVDVMQAINGTRALRSHFAQLPLYTKMLLQSRQRHDHMQLSSAPMLGCLLSHMAAWRRVRPGEIVAVLEEDALLDLVSAQRIHDLSVDLQDVPWDLLMLESGQLTITGTWMHVGALAATCAYRPTDDWTNTTMTLQPCTWLGSRGYLLTHAGAQTLLRHAQPIHVQVDALMGLVAAFEPRFRMYWPRSNVVHWDYLRWSTIFDGCIKCYMPSSPLYYVLAVVTVVGLFSYRKR